MKHVLCYITVPDAAVAQDIAAKLVSKHLVACANILPVVRSLYEWNGQLNDTVEVLVFCKAVADNVDDIVREVKAHHPSECPCITFLQISDGFPPFLAWIAAQCDKK